MLDFFGKKCGRTRKVFKMKVKRTTKDYNVTSIELSSNDNDDSYKCSSSENDEYKTESLEMDTTKPALQRNQCTKRLHRISWQTKENFPILGQTIKEEKRLGKLFKNGPSTASGIFLPQTTLNTIIKKLGDEDSTYENCFPIQKNSLLNEEHIKVLLDIIRKRDQTNNGVSWKEAIMLISDLGQASSAKVVENHLDYLIQMKKLSKLKKKSGCSTSNNK